MLLGLLQHFDKHCGANGEFSLESFYDVFLCNVLPSSDSPLCARAMEVLDGNRSGTIAWIEVQFAAAWTLDQSSELERAGPGRAVIATVADLVAAMFHMYILPSINSRATQEKSSRNLKKIVSINMLHAVSGRSQPSIPRSSSVTLTATASQAGTGTAAGRSSQEGGGSLQSVKLAPLPSRQLRPVSDLSVPVVGAESGISSTSAGGGSTGGGGAWSVSEVTSAALTPAGTRSGRELAESLTPALPSRLGGDSLRMAKPV